MSKALAAARAKRAEMKAMGLRTVVLNPLEKSRLDPTSLRKSIDAKCWDCVCGDADPAPRHRIRDCRCVDCPLYAVRPFQDVKGGRDEGIADD